MSRAPRIHPGDGDPRHGTTNGYANLGCRCSECKAAGTAARAVFQVARLAHEIDPDDPRHGLSSFYTNWGCRYGECRAAHTYSTVSARRGKKAS